MKRSIIFLLTFAIFSFVFASCSDLARDASAGGLGLTGSGGNSGGSGGTAAAQKYASVAGTAFASGAFPEELAAALNKIPASSAGMTNSPAISKSAFPQMAGADLQGFAYKFTAVKVGDESVYYEAAQDDISVSAEGLVSFGVNIPVLDAAVQYKIVCEAYLDAEKTKPVLKGESQKFEIGRESQTASASVPLGAIQESGCMGSVELLVALESGAESAIDSATMTISGLSSIAGVLSGSEYKFSSDANAVPCGARSARFSFKKGSQEVYAFTQIVNVYQNLETKTWVQNGAEPYFNTTVGADGKKTTACRLTSALLESWTLTDFFVDPSRSSDPTKPNYTSQSGTFINPCLTFDGALSKLVDKNKDYTIFINGTLIGAQAVPSTLKSDGSGETNARSLTISGKNSDPVVDILSGGFTQSHKGTTLTIATAVPITIKNITITGGYAQTNGGGIAIKGTSTVTPSVTLSDGAMVVGNAAATSGGGVYVEKAYLYMNGTAKVGGTDSGQGNSAQNGGGVYVNAGFLRLGKKSESAAAELSGGIYGNTATKEGGGISVNGSGYNVVNIEMLSGNISSNKVDGGTSGGGGVYLYCTVFDLKGGLIESNSIENPGASTCGGAININTVATLQIGGSVSIPYGGSLHKNDIAQKSSNTIELSSALDSDFAATVVANAFALDSEVLSGTEELLASECFKFNVFQPEEASQFLFVGMQGKLRTLISFPNGTKDGTETNEDDGLSYDVYKYSYINYDNLSMSVVNPYAALGYTIQAKVDGEFPEDLTKLEDGFHTVYAKIEKAGKPTIEDTVRVCVKIKTVGLTLYKGEINPGYGKYKGRVAINGGEVRSWSSWTGWSDPTFNTNNWSFTVDAKDYKFLCQTTGSYGRNGSTGNNPIRDAYRQCTLAEIRNNDGQGKAYINIYSGTYPDPSGHANNYLTLQLWFYLTD